MPTDPISMGVSLFFVINVLGNIPLFIGLLKDYSAKEQRFIIVRELLIALGILFLFSFFGKGVLHLLGISQPIIGITGGALLLIIAITMIFPKHSSAGLPKHQPIIVPLAIPTVAGPGSITAVMVFATQLQNPILMTGVILAAWISFLIIVLLATNLKKILGEKGLMAMERLGGM
ncbi:MAG: hypothetical protein KAR79_00235, partial [Simkaniaceae bacterium]|nr:hypothetical protein [Simkaniaceae bacterium]